MEGGGAVVVVMHGEGSLDGGNGCPLLRTAVMTIRYSRYSM